MELVEKIARAVANSSPVSFAAMMSRRKAAPATIPRQMAMFLARKLTSCSSTEIGEFFDRDHSTVLHAEALIEKRFGLDHVLEQTGTRWLRPDIHFEALRDAVQNAAEIGFGALESMYRKEAA